MSIWGGIHLTFTASKIWTDELKFKAENHTIEVLEGLSSLESYLNSIANTYNVANHINQSSFETLAKTTHSKFPSLSLLLYVPSIEKSETQAYSYPRPYRGLVDERVRKNVYDLVNLAQQFVGEGMFSVKAEAVSGLTLPKGINNQNVFTVIIPVKSGSQEGNVLAFINVKEFLQRHMPSWKEIESIANVDIVIKDAGDAEVYARQFITYGSKDLLGFDYSYEQEFLGSTWQFIWSFSSISAGGANYIPGALIALFGFILTIGLSWIAWRQQNLSEEVRSEVVSRTNELEQTSRRFRLITDNAYDLISIVSINGDYEYFNSAYHRVLGYTKDELENINMTEFLHKDDVSSFKRALKQVESGRSATEITFRMRHKSGNWLYLEAVAKGLHDKEWRLTNVVVHCRDVTSRKEYADDLARSEQRFRDFADSSADWLWEVDSDLNFSYVSPGIKSTLGFNSDAMIGRSKLDVLFSNAKDATRELMDSRLQRHQPYRDLEFWTRSREGEDMCLRISGVPVFDERQKFVGYRGAATNITAVKHDQERMVKLATTDHLTGLLNRSRFSEELDKMVELAKRKRTEGVLLFIDLDQFKHINDTYGHEAGDAILQGVSEILQHSVRTTDVVARLGGDEFGIIMYDIEIAEAEMKVQRIINEIDQLRVNYKGAKLHVTMSIGMVRFPQEERGSSDLLMGADLAMYRAKDMGRNRMFVDSEGNAQEDDSVREQLKWAERLRKSLETGDFLMFYQPLVPVKKRSRPAFESLLRLQDENGNFGSPMLFISAAEHFGLIQKLDLSVIDRCFKTQMEYAKKGMDCDLSINLSSRSIGDADVVATIKDLIKDYRLDPSRFTFEVTETAAIHDPAAHRNIDNVKEFIDELRAMGFRFALDDFGVGFSSFNYIRTLKVDTIKIDGSYIRNLETSKDDQLFVKAVVDMAKGMGINTVAEFVENEAIVKKLLEIGVDYGQGYHLGKPDGDLATSFATFNNKSMIDFTTKPKSKVASKRKAPAKKAIIT